MPKVSDAHKEARRNQILDAAMVCFATQGIGNTTIAKICKQAGLSAGAVYGHFDSKEAILHAVYTRSLTQNRTFGEQIAQSDDPATTLRQLFAGIVHYVASPELRIAHQLSIQVFAASLSDPKLCDAYTSMHRQLNAQITAEFQKLQDDGLIPPHIDVQYALWVVVAGYTGLRVHAMLDDTLDLERFGRAFEQIFTTAFGLPPA